MSWDVGSHDFRARVEERLEEQDQKIDRIKQGLVGSVTLAEKTVVTVDAMRSELAALKRDNEELARNNEALAEFIRERLGAGGRGRVELAQAFERRAQ